MPERKGRRTFRSAVLAGMLALTLPASSWALTVVIEGAPLPAGTQFVVTGRPASGSVACNGVNYASAAYVVVLGEGLRLAFFAVVPSPGTKYSVDANNGACGNATNNYTITQTGGS